MQVSPTMIRNFLMCPRAYHIRKEFREFAKGRLTEPMMFGSIYDYVFRKCVEYKKEGFNMDRREALILTDELQRKAHFELVMDKYTREEITESMVDLFNKLSDGSIETPEYLQKRLRNDQFIAIPDFILKDGTVGDVKYGSMGKFVLQLQLTIGTILNGGDTTRGLLITAPEWKVTEIEINTPKILDALHKIRNNLIRFTEDHDWKMAMLENFRCSPVACADHFFLFKTTDRNDGNKYCTVCGEKKVRVSEVPIPVYPFRFVVCSTCEKKNDLTTVLGE